MPNGVGYIHRYNNYLIKCGKEPIIIRGERKGSSSQPQSKPPLSGEEALVCELMQKIVELNANLSPSVFRARIVRACCNVLLEKKGLSAAQMKIRIQSSKIAEQKCNPLIPSTKQPQNHQLAPYLKAQHFDEFVECLEKCVQLGEREFAIDWANLQIARFWPLNKHLPILQVCNRAGFPLPKVKDPKLQEVLKLLYVSFALPGGSRDFLKELIQNIQNNCRLNKKARDFIGSILEAVSGKQNPQASFPCKFSLPFDEPAYNKLFEYANMEKPIDNVTQFIFEIRERAMQAVCQIRDLRFISASFLPLAEEEREAWASALSIVHDPEVPVKEKRAIVGALNAEPPHCSDQKVSSSQKAFLNSLKEQILRAEIEERRADFGAIAPDAISAYFGEIVCRHTEDLEDQLDYVIAYIAAASHPILEPLKLAAWKKVTHYNLQADVFTAKKYISNYSPQYTNVRSVENLLLNLERTKKLSEKLKIKIDLAVVGCHLQGFQAPDFVKPSFMSAATERSGVCSTADDSDFAVFANLLYGFTDIFDLKRKLTKKGKWLNGKTFSSKFSHEGKESAVSGYLGWMSYMHNGCKLEASMVRFVDLLKYSELSEHITAVAVKELVDLSDWTQDDLACIPGTSKRRGILFYGDGGEFYPSNKLDNSQLRFLVYTIDNRHVLLTRDKENHWHLFDPVGISAFEAPLHPRLTYLGQGTYEEILQNSEELSAIEVSKGFVAALFGDSAGAFSGNSL